ncbi:MAG: O-antigen ligase family protein [Erysipelotrichales bacterium]|nr:O-antigen ligase family protein [Erysipelotrichales bacterium]
MKLYNNRALTTYFILQPIIDIITGIMKYNTSLTISLAMIVRFLFIIYCAIYLIKSKNKKIFIFALIWLIYCTISTVGNFYIKNNFSIVHHIYNLFRVAYFQITLLFFYMYMKNNKSIDTKVFTSMGLIVGVSFIISLITNTSFCSYAEFDNCLERGYQGYFFSANEYGSILIALLGYQMIELLRNKKLINFVVLLMLTLFLCLLGTKTSIMGLYGLLIGFIVYHIVTLFIDKEKRLNNKYALVFFAILCVVTLCIKKLPVYFNLYTQYQVVVETNKNENPEITDEELKTQVSNSLVFNGRNDYVAVNKVIYKNAPLFNKLFGITDQDNYYEGQLMKQVNERDFHDLYMFYGIVGLIVELLLPGYLFFKLISSLIKKIKVLLNDETVILGFTLVLLLGVGYMAGHSLLHPGVSFYIAYVINDLIKKVDKIS